MIHTLAKQDTTQHKPDEMLDPDVRFLLANERTLLAWARTALAVIAGGVAFAQFGESMPQVSFGIAAMLFGGAIAALGYSRFRMADTAIRNGRLPAAGHGPILQIAGVVVIAATIAFIEIIQL